MQRHRRGAHSRCGHDSFRDSVHGRLQAGDSSGVGADAVLRRQGYSVNLSLRLSLPHSHVGDFSGQLLKAGAGLRVTLDGCFVDLDGNVVRILLCGQLGDLSLESVDVSLTSGVAVPSKDTAKQTASVGVEQS